MLSLALGCWAVPTLGLLRFFELAGSAFWWSLLLCEAPSMAEPAQENYIMDRH